MDFAYALAKLKEKRALAMKQQAELKRKKTSSSGAADQSDNPKEKIQKVTDRSKDVHDSSSTAAGLQDNVFDENFNDLFPNIFGMDVCPPFELPILPLVTGGSTAMAANTSTTSSEPTQILRPRPPPPSRRPAHGASCYVPMTHEQMWDIES